MHWCSEFATALRSRDDVLGQALEIMRSSPEEMAAEEWRKLV